MKIILLLALTSLAFGGHLRSLINSGVHSDAGSFAQAGTLSTAASTLLSFAETQAEANVMTKMLTAISHEEQSGVFESLAELYSADSIELTSSDQVFSSDVLAESGNRLLSYAETETEALTIEKMLASLSTEEQDAVADTLESLAEDKLYAQEASETEAALAQTAAMSSAANMLLSFAETAEEATIMNKMLSAISAQEQEAVLGSLAQLYGGEEDQVSTGDFLAESEYLSTSGNAIMAHATTEAEALVMERMLMQLDEEEQEQVSETLAEIFLGEEEESQTESLAQTSSSLKNRIMALADTRIRSAFF